MNKSLFLKNYILNILIIVSIFYLTLMHFIRIFNKNKTITGKIKNEYNIDLLMSELDNEYLINTDNSKHFYYSNMTSSIKSKIDIVIDEVNDILGEEFKNIPEINEIYYTSKKSGKTSTDRAFEMIHTDSPFYYCDVYRVLVCLKPNKNVTTNIPGDNYSNKLSKYEFVGFDYANTFHYIDIDNTIPDDNRVILKLQFRKGTICEKLTKSWNITTRDDIFEPGKNNNNLRGYFMLNEQIFASNSEYFIVLFYLIAYFYFTSKKQNNLLMRLLYIPIIIFVYCNISTIRMLLK
tara:strand:- start:506 stop:1381 length:876 start_codon:yes stop_codon:yes gene_type:complete